MCGRARCTLRADGIPRACHVNSRPVRSLDMNRYQPSNNVTPGRDMPVIRREDGGNTDGVVLHCMKWGLIPSFTKKTDKPDYFKMFNARSESISEKASFRRLIPNNRCLVTVEGFYEWKKDGSKKQPYYIHFKDGRPLVFAALYDSWKNAEGEILYTFTIVTTSSSSAFQWLHDRMPVILGRKESTDSWLIGSSSSKFETLLKPYEDNDLVWYPVTPAMGKPSFDGPECIKEIKLKTETNPISNFFSKKVVSSEQEPKTVTHSNELKSLKEEPEIEESPDSSSMDYKINDESKDSKPNISHAETEDPPVKRDYQEFSADTKPSGGKIEKARISPTRKKGKVAAASDKQPTLLSFFGKKS